MKSCVPEYFVACSPFIAPWDAQLPMSLSATNLSAPVDQGYFSVLLNFLGCFFLFTPFAKCVAVYQKMFQSIVFTDGSDDRDRVKVKVFYGQEPPSGESITTDRGVNYQLLAVITEVSQWGTPSCSRPQLATENSVGDGRSNWLVA